MTDIYREVVSGDTIAARPMMQRVLSEVEQGVWSGVLVMEVERLARGDTIDQGIIAQTFKFSGTKIITPIKTYDPDNEFDEEYFEFGLFMSRREYKIINRRLQRGRLASAKEGKWPSGLAPFGYRRVKLKNEKGCSLEPIEEQAAIVRMIFDLYTAGLQDEDGSARPLSLGSIATRLNDMHIPSPSGSQWARITIRGIIKNPTYIGMVRWGSRETKKKVVDGKVVSVRGPADPEKECVFKGIHPPLIPKETFELANDKLTRSENTSTHKEKVVRNPLAGLLVCSECGRQMMRMINPVHPDMPVVRCPRRGCPNCSSYLPIVEERVIQGLSEWMKGYELEWSSAAASSSVSSVGVREKLSPARRPSSANYSSSSNAPTTSSSRASTTQTPFCPAPECSPTKSLLQRKASPAAPASWPRRSSGRPAVVTSSPRLRICSTCTRCSKRPRRKTLS